MSVARQSADYWHWFSRPIPFSSPEPVVSWSRRACLARVQFSSLASRWKTREKIAPVMRATYTRFENKQSKRLFSFFLNLGRGVGGWGGGVSIFRGRERGGQREQSSFFLALPLPLAWVAGGPCIVSTICILRWFRVSATQATSLPPPFRLASFGVRLCSEPQRKWKTH